MQRSRSILTFFTGLLFVGCTGAIPSESSEAGDGDPGKGGGAGRAGGGGAGGGDEVQGVSVGPSQWRRLTGDQYIKIVKDVLGVEISRSVFLADTLTGQFASNIVPAQDSEVDRYATAAESVANKVDAVALARCTQPNRACAEKFLAEVGPRLYRKPLQPAESAGLLKLFDLGNADGFKAGASLVIRSMLQSPSMLYLVEFGQSDKQTGLHKLGSHEVAARLALLLWNSAPDAALLAAAAAKELDTPEQIKQQAERMMKDPRFGLSVADFHLQLFHVNKLTMEGAIEKSSLGGFSAEIRKAMVDETSAFVIDAVNSQQATIANLFTAKHSFVPKELLTFNNISAVSSKANGRVEFSDGARAGLLTMSGFMTAEPPTPTLYGAVQRGKIIRENVLCQHMPAPPPGLNFKTPPDADTTPPRTLLAQHQQDKTCKGCHELMDSIGFAFENYDAFGRYRTKYPRGEAVDASGSVVGETEAEGDFAGPQQLGAILSKSSTVRLCMADHWFRYALGREPTDEDKPSVARLGRSLEEGDGDLPSALLEFVQSDAFRFIQGVQ